MNLSSGVGGAPSQKPCLKNGMVEIFLMLGCIQHVQITQIQSFIRRQFIPGVGGAPNSWKPYLKNGTVEKFLDGAILFNMFKCPKISHLSDKRLSPRVGGAPSQ